MFVVPQAAAVQVKERGRVMEARRVARMASKVRTRTRSVGTVEAVWMRGPGSRLWPLGSETSTAQARRVLLSAEVLSLAAVLVLVLV